METASQLFGTLDQNGVGDGGKTAVSYLGLKGY